MTIKKIILILAVGAFLGMVTAVVFRNTPRVSPRWIAYMYTSKHREVPPVDLPGDFGGEMDCRKEAESGLRNQFKLMNTVEGPIYADAYMCGRACHTELFTINNTIAEIVCEESYMSLYHGDAPK